MQNKKNTAECEERFFQDIPSKTMLITLCIVVTLFGGLLMVAGIVQTLKGPQPDNIFLSVLGSGILVAVWRFWQVTTGPRMIISPTDIYLQKFFYRKRWQIKEISSIASFPTIVYPRTPSGRALSPLNIHYLGIKTKAGRVSKFALPDFVGNEQVLASLASKTNLKLEDIKDDAAFKSWFKGV